MFSGRAHVGQDPAGDLSGDNQRDAVIVSETNVEYRLFADPSRHFPRKWLFLLNKKDDKKKSKKKKKRRKKIKKRKRGV